MLEKAQLDVLDDAARQLDCWRCRRRCGFGMNIFSLIQRTMISTSCRNLLAFHFPTDHIAPADVDLVFQRRVADGANASS